MEKTKFIEAGRITNTHGIAGEVRIEVWLDSPRFFKSFKRIIVRDAEYKIVSAREHKGCIIAKLAGIDNVNDAMPLKGQTVYIIREDAKLPKGACFIQDLIGARVQDENGAEVGILTEVMETPASLIYVVKGEQEHLIPAVPEFVMSTNADAGIVTVHLIEGM